MVGDSLGMEGAKELQLVQRLSGRAASLAGSGGWRGLEETPKYVGPVVAWYVGVTRTQLRS